MEEMENGAREETESGVTMEETSICIISHNSSMQQSSGFESPRK